MDKLDEAIHKVKLRDNHFPNFFGIKDFYIIKNKKVYVKSYITLIHFRYFSINDYDGNDHKSFIKFLNDLKIIYSKCNNRENSYEAKENALDLYYFLYPEEQFCTVEIEYCYSLENKEKFDYVRFEHGNCGNGFYYQLSINYDINEYKSYSFLRKNPYKITDNNVINFESFYLSYKDKYNYDYLYLYKK